MKFKTSTSLTVLGFCVMVISLRAQTAPAAAAAPNSASLTAQTNALVEKVNKKLEAGAHTEADLAPEIKEFDAILAAHQGEKTDAVAHVAVMKDALYIEVFNEPEKGLDLFKQLAKDFPDTPTAKQIAEAIPALEAQIKSQGAALAIQRTLVPGAAFPDFSVKGVNGEDLSVAKYKGKLVLVDFWATWCGPCVQEMPNVIAAYNKFHSQGFEIIGVSLDQENDKPKLLDFTKQHQMPWPQFYDGKYWQNELAVKYGVNSIPTNFLIDPTGKIIGVGLRGEELAAAVAKALPSK